MARSALSDSASRKRVGSLPPAFGHGVLRCARRDISQSLHPLFMRCARTRAVPVSSKDAHRSKPIGNGSQMPRGRSSACGLHSFHKRTVPIQTVAERDRNGNWGPNSDAGNEFARGRIIAYPVHLTAAGQPRGGEPLVERPCRRVLSAHLLLDTRPRQRSVWIRQDLSVALEPSDEGTGVHRVARF